MSSADLPPLDLNELNFDTCERLRHLDGLLHQLGLEHGARVLDVGGYPGVMARAFPHWNIVTADTYAKGHPPYVKASGAALPFQDRNFDATIACDVLEHVPQQYRESFLRELARVTESAVIVAGPYNTPGAAKAEALVRELLPVSSPAQAWLAEHAECGLPSLDSTRRALGAAAAETGVAPAGDLTSWLLFFAAQAAGESNYAVGIALKNFITHYNKTHGGDASLRSGTGPAYRHAVIAAMNAAAALKLSEIAGEAPYADESSAEHESYVEALAELVRALAAAGGSGATSADSQMTGSLLEREYIERLERMLADRQVEAPSLASHNHDGAFGARLKAAVKVLLGRS